MDLVRHGKILLSQPVRGSGTPCEHPAGKSRTEMCSWGDCKKCMGR